MKNQKNQKKTNTDDVPNPSKVLTVSEGQDWSPGEISTYVVIRRTYGIDLRVSDREYKNQSDPKAISEMNFWNRAIKFHPDGTWAEIVKFDSRKHRTW